MALHAFFFVGFAAHVSKRCKSGIRPVGQADILPDGRQVQVGSSHTYDMTGCHVPYPLFYCSSGKDIAEVKDVYCEEESEGRWMLGKILTQRVNLWSDEQKSLIRLYIRVRLHNKPKPDNYTELCIASMKNNLDDINGWLYHRIRMCIWKQWKLSRIKERNLIKLGIPEYYAHMVELRKNRQK